MSSEARGVIFIMYTLAAIGVIMIYSASAVYADQFFASSTYFLRRHLFYLTIGSLLFSLSVNVNLEFLRRHSKSFMMFAFLLLILVLVPHVGHSAGGAKRWIGVAFFSFQPVEYAKLAACLYFSDYLTRKMKPLADDVRFVLVPPLAVLGFLLALLISQPDLGSSIFILMITSILFFLAGIRLYYAAFAALPVVLGLTLLILQAPYRLNRIVAYLNPWKDPKGTGFQIIQSFVAFATGGIKGVGLGQSTQKLFYLPQSYTDFIFSIIAEEMGLLGALSVLFLYGLFFVLGLRIANKTREPFYRLFAFSLVLMITLQAVIHVLVTTGLVPTKGLPLPFVSFGGTALIFEMVAVGILIAVDRQISHPSFPRS